VEEEEGHFLRRTLLCNYGDGYSTTGVEERKFYFYELFSKCLRLGDAFEIRAECNVLLKLMLLLLLILLLVAAGETVLGLTVMVLLSNRIDLVELFM